MNGFGYSTAGLLFPAISLLMLAYTNRFLGLASVARHLVARHQEKPDDRLRDQVANLRTRLRLLRHVQAMGVLSLICCTASIFALFLGDELMARLTFSAALIFMLVSLVVSLTEIHISIRAIGIELDGLTEARA